MKKYSTHTHSTNSRDGKSTVDEMCQAAIAAGFSGISVTDHCDISMFEERRVLERIAASTGDAAQAREKYADKLFVGVGVEFSDPQYRPERWHEIIDLADYDIVVGSSHVPFYCDCGSFVRFNWETVDDDYLDRFIHGYFKSISDIAQNYPIDVLAHIYRPLRYMNLRYGRGVRLEDYTDEIEKVLEILVKRDIALEVNMVDLNGEDHTTFGMCDIAKMFRSLGGKYVTIGTDAHKVETIDSNFDLGAETLRKAGFENYYYYRKHTPVAVSLYE